MNATKPGLVFLCDYWSRMSANAACVEALLPSLKLKYNVTVVSVDLPSLPPTGVEFVLVGDIGINKLLAKFRSCKPIFDAARLGYKAMVARNIFRFPIRSSEWVHRYADALRSVLERGNVSLVVAVSYPAEGVEAAMRLAADFSGASFVGYFLDAASVGMYRCGGLVQRITSRSASRFERRALRTLDGAVFLSSARDIVEHIHGKGSPKITFADVPFMAADSVEYHHRRDAGPFRILYTGTLANPDRNPQRLIDALACFCGDGRAEICFAGDDAGLLDQQGGTRPYVKKLGMLTTAECQNAILSSDALLSIGNKDPHLIPSKLFRYMAAGKPIIHVKRGQGDSCVPYLERYPLSLVVDDEDPDGLCSAVGRFVSSLAAADGMSIPLRRLFPEAYPEYTVAAFESFGNRRV